MLIADDEQHIGEALRLLLRNDGFQTEVANSPASVLSAMDKQRFDAVLMDLNYSRGITSGDEGLQLVSQLHERDQSLPIVVMTAWGSVPLAVEAMRRGARDFVMKPWENAALLKTLREHVRAGHTARQVARGVHQREQELEEAQQIQRRLLPQEMPYMAGCEIAVEWLPALGVGGDYFDVLRFSETQAAVCIADVSGKGVPAALLMSNLQAAVKASALSGFAPQELCEKVNEIVCANRESGRFITFVYCLLDFERRRAVYVNAGHNVPIVVRADGSVGRLGEGGPVLGQFPGCRYVQGEIELTAGDRIVFFTDGISEARSPAGEEFGESRILEFVSANRNSSPNALKTALLDAVSQFTAGHYHDDATLLLVALK